MRLKLFLPSFALNLTRNDDGPYPWLMTVSPLSIGARAGTPAGLGVTESSNMTVIIDNRDNQFTRILRNPLRSRAEFYDDDDQLAFEGIVSATIPGLNVSLEIEA